MQLSQLKEEIRTIIRERSINAIQKEYGKVVSEMEHHLELYKKSKGTPEEKKHISALKTLTVQKKKLQSEIDTKVASLYKDAELKVEENINEVGINDWHFKAIEQLYKKAGAFGRKKIAALITKNPNASWNEIASELKDADYSDVSDYTDTLHLESVNESTLQKGKTYGGSKCEGGCFVGKTGLMKIIKISKENPKDVFMFREDNFSGLQPHFVKNGVIAKATVINPAYDFEKHKVNSLKIGNDVILSVRLFVSTNESVSEGKKAFKVNPGIGKSKYSISSHDGHKKHNDGSDFWDIQIYKNKVDLEKGIKDYKSKGFVEESINELKLIPKGNGIPGNFFKIKAKYNTFAEYEPHAKIGDTILKYSKKSPSMRAWLATGNLDDRAKQYLSKVHSIGTDGVNLTLFGKQTPASVHPSDKKELAVVVLQN